MNLWQKINIFFTKSELKKLVFLFVGMLIMALFETIGVTTIVPFIAVVVSPELIHENIYLVQIYNFFSFQSETNFIIFLGVVLITTLLISNSFQAFMVWIITYFTNMQGCRLSVRLLENYLERPYGFFLIRNTSELGKNVLTEVERVTTGIFMQSLLILSKIVVALFLFLLLLFVNPLIAITLVIFLGGIYSLIFKFVKHRLHHIGGATTEENFKRFKIANEAFSGIKEIKLHSSEQEFVKRFLSPAKKLAIFGSQKILIGSLPRYFLEVIAFGGIVAIIIFLLSSSNGLDNNIIPVISLYAMVGYRLMPALQQIYSSLTNLKFNIPAFEYLVKEFSNSNNEKKEEVKQSSMVFRERLQINKLNFKYQGSVTPVLNKLDLVIHHNTTVGIVGSTGSGKTTLIDIILGLHSPESGDISLDGLKINNQNILAWQKNIGYVPQSIYLTDDTILANIAFAVPGDEISIEKAKKAAKMANLHEFITSLPEEYETIVGERGVRLSGGQCQRIGIARALYHNPKVLILDEATSSLDSLTESAIMDAIRNLSHKKTIVIIAHRLSTLVECDIIHMMANGKIIDSGTYTQLIKNNTEFKKMSKQF